MFCEIPVFGRCCFCLPLRRGILIFGYLNILFAAFMVGVFSYAIHHDHALTMVFHGVAGDMDNWVCLVLYCTDIVLSAVLLYGAHRQIIIYLRVFYYYALCTLAAVVILEIIVASQRPFYMEIELLPVFFAGLCKLFAAFMVGVFSYAIHHDHALTMVFHGVAGDMDNWVCLVLYCTDIVLSAVLLYGAHRQIIIYLRVFYYYALCTLAAVVILEIIVASQRPFYMEIELLPVFFAGLCIHIYLIILVRSLLRKLEISGHTYENQLHQFVNGEIIKEPNTVYPSTVVPVETA